MTYWAREHEHNLRRIGDAIRDLDAVYEDLLPSLIRDLADDDHDATEDSRARLREARTHIAHAMGSIENARDQLPEPQRGPRFPTAADVMEREG